MINDNDIVIEETQVFESLPEDMYPVVISNITKGERVVFGQPDPNKKEDILRFEFTVLEGEYEGRKLFQSVRPKLASDPKPSNLYRIWSAVKGSKPEKIVKDGKETYDFHITSLLNQNLKVVTENKSKGDRTFSNIISYHTLKTKSSGNGIEYDTMKEMVTNSTKAVDENIAEDLPF